MQLAAVQLVLASASPRRAELLTAAGFSFDTVSVEVDERVQPAEAPIEYVCRLAAEKSGLGLERVLLDSHARRSDIVVIGADTAVVIDDEILGKPKDDAQARTMLRRLSGRVHEVVTGVSGRTEARELTVAETTSVWFAPLSDEEIEWCVASGECRDKAGAYAIQGRAARFIPRIDGSYSNVVGLPIAALHVLLARIGR